MIRRSLVLAPAVIAVACISMEGPKNGAASISVIGLPSPSVVKGDTMRDSLGNAAPLQIAAYDGSGNVLSGVKPAFFLLDTGLAVIDSAGRFISTGPTSSTGARVVATLDGLQTPPVPVPISVAPAFIMLTPGISDTLCALYSNEPDSTKTVSPPLSVTVKGSDSVSTAQGFIAIYSLRYSPASMDSVPTAYLSDDTGRPMARDTSKANGQTGRRVDLRFEKLANDSIRTGLESDSIGVDVSVLYRGSALPGSPIHFVVPIRVRVTGTCSS